DVDRRHRERARGRVNKRYRNNDCKMYTDYRELIGRGDLDALMHALPDHWHALPVIAAAKAGCDIHGQKPFSRSIREGRAMCDAIHRYGRVWQTGSQQRSDGRFRFACELVRNGRIGKVHRVEVGLPTGGGGGNTAPKPVPDHLDWDMWLGPAPWRPYQGFGPHWSWRWILDYSGGQLTDWCGHHVDIAHWGLGYDRTGPVEIEGKGKYPTEGLFDAPTHYNFTCKYKTGVEINVTNNQINAQGAKWIGERGWVYVKRGRIDSEPKSLLREKIGAGEIRLYNSGGHKRNFVDCIFNRKETICPAEVGHRSISVGLLGEIAMLTGRKIRFDPDKEEIIGDPGASALLGRPYREPWQL
ncbi:MAG: Gfo/Idh/MocA family protein, partial [Planctomycetota bacterium]